MNARSIILAVTCVLIASVFAIWFLATKETHDMFAEGEKVTATVVRVKPGDPPKVTVKLDDAEDDDAERGCELTAPADGKLDPGDEITVYVHKRSPFRVATARGLAASDPSPAVLLGTAGFLGLGVWVLFGPRRAAKRRASRTSSLDVLTDSLRRTRALSLVTGVGIVAFGGGMIWLGASGADRTASTGTNVGVAVLGGVFAVFGALIAGRGLRLLSIDRSWIMQVILQRPHEIAWIYELVVRSEVGGDVSATSNVHLWFRDGRSYSIAVEREDARALIAELSRRAPQALVGYSSENEQQYKQRRAA